MQKYNIDKIEREFKNTADKRTQEYQSEIDRIKSEIEHERQASRQVALQVEELFTEVGNKTTQV